MAFNYLNPGSALYESELERRRKSQLEQVGLEMQRQHQVLELTLKRDELQRKQEQRNLAESLKAMTDPTYRPNFTSNPDLPILNRQIAILK